MAKVRFFQKQVKSQGQSHKVKNLNAIYLFICFYMFQNGQSTLLLRYNIQAHVPISIA